MADLLSPQELSSLWQRLDAIKFSGFLALFEHAEARQAKEKTQVMRDLDA